MCCSPKLHIKATASATSNILHHGRQDQIQRRSQKHSPQKHLTQSCNTFTKDSQKNSAYLQSPPFWRTSIQQNSKYRLYQAPDSTLALPSAPEIMFRKACWRTRNCSPEGSGWLPRCFGRSRFSLASRCLDDRLFKFLPFYQ